MWSMGLRTPLGKRVDMPIRLLLGYSLARSDDAILVAIVMLMCGLLCSSGHEAAGPYGSFAASSFPKWVRNIKLQGRYSRSEVRTKEICTQMVIIW